MIQERPELRRPIRSNYYGCAVSLSAADPSGAMMKKDENRLSRQVLAPRDRLIVRPFETGDATAVRSLFIEVNRLMAPPHLAAQFETYITRSLRQEIDRIPCYYKERGGQFFVATIANGLAGMFGLEQAEPGVAELRRMYVHPQHRRRGIGHKLIDRAEREARTRGISRMILSTSELQVDAFKLYHNAGYRLVRQEIATRSTNKTVGGSIRRFHFEKALMPIP